MKRRSISIGILLSLSVLLSSYGSGAADPRLKSSLRQPERNGWIYVHLEGTPAEVGFQHGYHLAPEIEEARKVIALEITHDTRRDWQFYREASERMLWPRIEAEYREELNGIVEGLKARGVKLDLWDIVAMNAWPEFPYYSNWLARQKPSGSAPPTAPIAERCSAFVATGSFTTDGRVVIGHNNWTSYLGGQRWNIIFDIAPEKGHRILMDGFPGLIHSGDDFGINAAGMMITETTITGFSGWDPKGIAEFVRARKAMQYSTSIEDFVGIMKEGNNGGYANNWLVADRKTGEIASLELGLKHVTLRRSRNGYFLGANAPVNRDLTREETDFDPNDRSLSANARRIRWRQLMAEYRGRIDVAAGQKLISDHYDSFAKKTDPNERSLCGHIDLSPRGVKSWQSPYAPAGTVQAKVTDSVMAERMSFVAAMGHPCGTGFKAAAHLARHTQFDWQKVYLKDLDSHPWTEFSIQR